MTHTYQISGITCDGCVAKVKGLLGKLPEITAVELGLDGNAQISMNRHVATTDLQAALRDYPKYQLRETQVTMPALSSTMEEAAPASFWATYKPILLVFGYLLGATILAEATTGSWDWMEWMRYFMAGFFLVFSFFKLLDVPAFAASYSSYDVVAQRWPGWGYVYPFVELALGILFLINFNPLVTNSVALVVMGVSTIGVVQSLLAKRKFQCACLGAIFNLPMSNITLFEDVLMVAMSAAMLLMHI